MDGCDGGKWGPLVESVVDHAWEGRNLKVLCEKKKFHDIEKQILTYRCLC